MFLASPFHHKLKLGLTRQDLHIDHVARWEAVDAQQTVACLDPTPCASASRYDLDNG